MKVKTWDDLTEFFHAWVERLREAEHWLRPDHIAGMLVKVARCMDAFLMIPNRNHFRSAGPSGGMVHVPQVKEAARPNMAVAVRLPNGKSYEFNGRRWRPWVSRDDMEDELGCWPGFIDGLEAAHKAYGEVEGMVVEHIRAKDRERHQILHRERQSLWRSMDQAHAAAQEAARLGRHPTLEAWRSRNPVPRDEVPDSLSSVPHVKRLEARQPCHVYFLLREGEVVYVGKTTTAWPSRIDQHVCDDGKEFDDVWFLEVDYSSVSRVEMEYIRRFEPEYNVAGLPRGVS